MIQVFQIEIYLHLNVPHTISVRNVQQGFRNANLPSDKSADRDATNPNSHASYLEGTTGLKKI